MNPDTGPGRRVTRLAIDLGAESGRLVEGRLDACGRLSLEETFRFPNGPSMIGGRLRWDAEALWKRLLEGLCRTSESGNSPASLSVDGWGVDFVLLDEKGTLCEQPLSYRDGRLPCAMEAFLRRMGRDTLHRLTGIQVMPINTLFQLFEMTESGSPALARASRLLFIPDYFAYLLTGCRRTEATVASTSGMADPATGSWSVEVVEAAGIDGGILGRIEAPCALLGGLSPAVESIAGLCGTLVYSGASHDTACAVAALPASGDDFAYISSGTWSLVGVEARSPALSSGAAEANITSEAGICGTWRVLRNLSGLWLFQQLRRSLPHGEAPGYGELAAMAEDAEPFAALIDPESPEFLAPGRFLEAVEAFLGRTGQSMPATTGGIARCLLESLALSSRRGLESVLSVTGRKPGVLHIAGGGSRNAPLCRMTASAIGIPVLAGPSEATAAGNILCQMLAEGELSGLGEIREVSRRSFPVSEHLPDGRDEWDRAYERFLRISESDSQRRQEGGSR
ncbi:rhamnulokinase [Candidatus Fermentibacteria bacterium]|nr:rhamnulokinase [Candidatus Fermentibacteria bacterium]